MGDCVTPMSPTGQMISLSRFGHLYPYRKPNRMFGTTTLTITDCYVSIPAVNVQQRDAAVNSPRYTYIYNYCTQKWILLYCSVLYCNICIYRLYGLHLYNYYYCILCLYVNFVIKDFFLGGGGGGGLWCLVHAWSLYSNLCTYMWIRWYTLLQGEAYLVHVYTSTKPSSW